jgi:hypothetical protein
MYNCLLRLFIQFTLYYMAYAIQKGYEKGKTKLMYERVILHIIATNLQHKYALRGPGSRKSYV